MKTSAILLKDKFCGTYVGIFIILHRILPNLNPGMFVGSPGGEVKASPSRLAMSPTAYHSLHTCIVTFECMVVNFHPFV